MQAAVKIWIAGTCYEINITYNQVTISWGNYVIISPETAYNNSGAREAANTSTSEGGLTGRSYTMVGKFFSDPAESNYAEYNDSGAELTMEDHDDPGNDNLANLPESTGPIIHPAQKAFNQWLGFLPSMNNVGNSANTGNFWYDLLYTFVDGCPVVGSANRGNNNWNQGNYWTSLGWYGIATIEAFTLGAPIVKGSSIVGENISKGITSLLANFSSKSTTIKPFYEYSVHAVEQMSKRGITEKMIDVTIRNGEKFFDPKGGTYIYYLRNATAKGKDIMVATSSANPNRIVTTNIGRDIFSNRWIPIK